MARNSVSVAVGLLPNMLGPKDYSSWEKIINKSRTDGKYKSRTCCIYNNKPNSSTTADDAACPCGRLVRRHSFNGQSLEQKALSKGTQTYQPPAEFLDGPMHSTKVPLNVFGQLSTNGCKFLRIDERCKMSDLFDLILRDCDQVKPALILSVYGGAKYFSMAERLEKEFIRGVIDAATMADAWILTAGINNGVSKLVGEGILHCRLLREHVDKVKCIGLTMWGSVSEKTRAALKSLSKNYPIDLQLRQIPDRVEEEKETIEPNHTHCILFDSGRLNGYLSDSQRHELVKVACSQPGDVCYAVTIIVEGGLGSLEVLKNDIEEGRPTVLIQGSGRLADLLANLINQTSTADGLQHWNPTQQEVENALDRFFPNAALPSISADIRQLKGILDEKNRYLLHVFSLERDKNVSETIFEAIFSAKNKKTKKEKSQISASGTHEQEQKWRTDEDKLVDLALKWDHFDGILPILQARQEEILKEKKNDFIQEDIKRQKGLFRQSLDQDRPRFVDFFLSAGFDPVTLMEESKFRSYSEFLRDLYTKTYTGLGKHHKQHVVRLFGPVPTSLKTIDERLNKFVGAYLQPIYVFYENNLSNRIATDLQNHTCLSICCGICGRAEHLVKEEEYSIIGEGVQSIAPKNDSLPKCRFLRDLFLWAVFLDMPEMAKVLLLHIQPRICAALIASAIYKNYAYRSTTVHLKEKYKLQSLEFETYAARCIDKCYGYNEALACELLLREIPLFGRVTCMQVAIAGESSKLLETACFDQTLNQVWFNKLALITHRASAQWFRLLAVLTLGLLAPVFLTYRDVEPQPKAEDSASLRLSNAGINYYMTQKNHQNNGCTIFWKKFVYFHESPMIKMSYHFISYIWFLLAFSYMMLYHLDGRDTFVIPHWTEIYVIITVSTMFCEEIRKLYHEYNTHMIERWGSTGSTILDFLSNLFFILPYFLFYLGLGFRYASYNEGLLSTARILWALDLELWYLRSLKFVIALKSLGPKLFMLKNMLRDLFAFVYMIFIAVVAYGVVSRAMIQYKQVPFTGRGIGTEIFYGPYWFIYGEVEDKKLLDDRLANNTESGEAEATATHVLLAFHMLFINVLLLNLLIAVFAYSIGKVQENTEFYWRYQRYSFVREYFERVPVGYPPLIFFSHAALLFLAVWRRCCGKLCQNRVFGVDHKTIGKPATSMFKMIPIDEEEQSEEWDAFENAATHSYARSVLEQNRSQINSFGLDETSKRMTTTTIDTITSATTAGPTSDLSVFEEKLANTLRLCLSETQKNLEQNITTVNHRLDQMHESMEWMMEAMERVKMNRRGKPKPTFDGSSATNAESTTK